jgi:hypothetical protein
MSEEDAFLDQLNRESEKLDRERNERIKERGDLPFLPSMQKGSTKLYLLRKFPKTIEPKESDQFQTIRGAFSVHATPRKNFDVEKDVEYAWTVNKNSPTYRKLIELLAKAPLQIEVVKTGEAKQTRYDVEAAE